MGVCRPFKPQCALHLLWNIALFGSLLSVAAAHNDSAKLRECLSSSSILASLTTFSDATNWETITSPWALRFQPEPAAVVVPRTKDEVAVALACAVDAGVKVSALNGGHSYGAYGLGGVDGALVINMERFTETTFDKATHLFTCVTSKSVSRCVMLTTIAMVEEAELDQLQHGSGRTTGATSPTSVLTGSVFLALQSGAALEQQVVSSALLWTILTALK
jgi:hypothetical protein